MSFIRGMDISATGIFAATQRIEVTSNNVANINTNGFKRGEARFADVLYQRLVTPGNPTNLNETGVGVELGKGVQLSSVTTLFEQGSFVPGFDLDLAINGEGFFRVTDVEGNVFYTRNGAFQPKGAGAAGALNLQLGDRSVTLDPAIILPGQNAIASVSSDGTLTQGTFTASISLTRFQNPDGLEQVGDLLFRETIASGLATTGTPSTPGFGSIVNGALEGSNVDLSNELIALVQGSQAFALNSQSFQTGNEEIRQVIALVQQS